MKIVKKVYGYITRMKDSRPQILVFEHSIREAGIQIPKGTVERNENTFDAVIREVKEETGLKNIEVEALLADDHWEYKKGIIHHRFFYKINVMDEREGWEHQPTGGGSEDGLLFRLFWISSPEEVDLVRGHGDYLHLIFT
ncbi:NUDIX hydrolase [Niallia sp. 03133]|uniref:NUDIX hydrolase n=1 Tax=Niallia sp. 03133 TaxID=3458060 RepID=UPI0040451927